MTTITNLAEYRKGLQDAELDKKATQFADDVIATTLFGDNELNNSVLKAILSKAESIHKMTHNEENPSLPPVSIEEVSADTPLYASRSMTYNVTPVYSVGSLRLDFDGASYAAHFPTDTPHSDLTQFTILLERELLVNHIKNRESPIMKAFSAIAPAKDAKEWLPEPLDNSFLEIILNNAKNISVLALNEDKTKLNKNDVTPEAILNEAKYSLRALYLSEHNKEITIAFEESKVSCHIELPDSFTLSNVNKIATRLFEENSKNTSYFHDNNPRIEAYAKRAGELDIDLGLDVDREMSTDEIINQLKQSLENAGVASDDEKEPENQEVKRDSNVYSPKFR